MEKMQNLSAPKINHQIQMVGKLQNKNPKLLDGIWDF
jgi:hypothetical protein